MSNIFIIIEAGIAAIAGLLAMYYVIRIKRTRILRSKIWNKLLICIIIFLLKWTFAVILIVAYYNTMLISWTSIIYEALTILAAIFLYLHVYGLYWDLIEAFPRRNKEALVEKKKEDFEISKREYEGE